MEQQQPKEQALLQEGTVQITDKRAVLSGKTYSMANITSVSSLELKPTVALPGVLIALGVVSLILYVVLLASDQNVTGLLILGLLLGGGGAVWYFAKGGTKYVVRIGSASGEVDGLVSSDQAYVERIVKAMNDAIVLRG